MSDLRWLWEKVRPPDLWQAAFNILLLVVGIFQWRIYQRQAEIMNEQLLSLRAYVTLERLTNNHVEADGNVAAVSFTPEWKNSGNTPARNVQYYTVCDFSSDGKPRDPMFRILASNQNRTVIGPGITELGPTTRDISAQEMKDLAANKHSICIYGAIDYTDVFGMKHRTEFSVMTPFGQGIDGNRPLAFTKTLSHNGADEDCMRQPYATPLDSMAAAGANASRQK
jgi:hypothetical protein